MCVRAAFAWLHSPAQPCTALHSPAQPCTATATALHNPAQPCTSLDLTGLFGRVARPYNCAAPDVDRSNVLVAFTLLLPFRLRFTVWFPQTNCATDPSTTMQVADPKRHYQADGRQIGRAMLACTNRARTRQSARQSATQGSLQGVGTRRRRRLSSSKQAAQDCRTRVSVCGQSLNRQDLSLRCNPACVSGWADILATSRTNRLCGVCGGGGGGGA